MQVVSCLLHPLWVCIYELVAAITIDNTFNVLAVAMIATYHVMLAILGAVDLFFHLKEIGFFIGGNLC